MTKSWTKKHWFLLTIGVCLLILIFWPGSGAADAVRIIWHQILHLLSTIVVQLLGLINQLIDKV